MNSSYQNITITPKQPWMNLFKAIYVFLFFWFFNFEFFRTTMLWRERYQGYRESLILTFDRLTTLLVCLSVFYFLFIYKNIRERIFVATIFTLSIIYSHIRDINTVNTALVFFLLLICSKDNSYKVIARISIACGSFWIIYSAIACKLGYISDVISEGRHSFGSVYVTDLFCHFLTLFMALCILRGGILRFYDYLLAFIILTINILYMHAKVGFVCFLILLSGTFFYQYIRPKIQLTRHSIRLLSIIAVSSFVLLAVLAILISYYYSTSPSVWYNKFHLLSTLRSRYKQSYQAFENYSIVPWGQYIEEHGNGGITDGRSVDNYFFLDISFIRILFLNGWVILLLLLTICTTLQIKLFRNKQYYALFVVAVFAIDCSVEHHLLDISNNVFPYLLFATSSKIPNTLIETTKDQNLHVPSKPIN